jgi:putative acetyltransferase
VTDIRPERPADVAVIRTVVHDAFWAPDRTDPGEPALVDALRDSGAWRPGLSMVAECDGEVVAHALLSRVTVEPGGVPALSLGPVAVLPAHQATGLGSAVVRAVLDAARDQSERLVVVLGSPDYYGRFGFGPATGLTAPWSGTEHWQALTLDGSPLPAGEVRYPAPWFAL